jgi:hypothetical protein
MERVLTPKKRACRDAAIAFLQAYKEGRPLEELRTALPRELEFTGQREAAGIVRSFFRLPGYGAGMERLAS